MLIKMICITLNRPKLPQSALNTKRRAFVNTRGLEIIRIQTTAMTTIGTAKSADKKISIKEMIKMNAEKMLITCGFQKVVSTNNIITYKKDNIHVTYLKLIDNLWEKSMFGGILQSQKDINAVNAKLNELNGGNNDR